MCDQATILRNGVDVADLDLAGVDEAELVTAMLGEELVEEVASRLGLERLLGPTRRRPILRQPVVLDARDLHLRDKVNGVSFELRRGEILGLTALEGQGQDELFQVLSGDHRPTSGELLVNGERLNARSPYDAIRKGVVLVPADRQQALFPQRSVRENLATPLYNRASKWFSLAGDEAERVDRAVDAARHRRASRQPGAASLRRQPAEGHHWSLACVRVRHPAVFRSDPRHRHPDQSPDLRPAAGDCRRRVRRYSSTRANCREIPLVCDRVLVMYNGRIVHEQDAATATEEVLLTSAHGLEEAAA